MNTANTPRRSRGFTLIEVMIATAITGVLSSIAYPSFKGTIHKVRRSDAMVAMLQVQAAQERWRSNNIAYGSLAEIRQSAVSAAGHYDIGLQGASAAGYEIVATARGAQRGDNACRTLKMSVTGLNASYASGADESLGNRDDVNRQCWNL